MIFLSRCIFALFILLSTPVLAEIIQEEKLAMDAGYAAVNKGDFLLAIEHFEEARRLVIVRSDVYYNLALAESMVPGREFRAIAWFGAFLFIDPESPKSPAIKEQIKILDKRALDRLLSITEEAANQLQDEYYKNAYLEHVTILWAQAGNYAAALKTAQSIKSEDKRNSALYQIANAQAEANDLPAAFKTTDLIPSLNNKGAAQRSIAIAQMEAGDMQAALQSIERIQDPFCISTTKEHLARKQFKEGNKEGALKTLAEAVLVTTKIDSMNLRASAKEGISFEQALTGDIDAARKTADSIKDDVASDQGHIIHLNFARQRIAEVQATLGDVEGSRQSMEIALQTAKDTPESPFGSLAMEYYNQVKARIENGTAGSIWQETIKAEPDLLLDDWLNMNESTFNAPEYLDLKGYLAQLPTDSPGGVFETLKAAATKMVDAHHTIAKMFKGWKEK